eukprot:3937001-Rhodomonas_salina.1
MDIKVHIDRDRDETEAGTGTGTQTETGTETETKTETGTETETETRFSLLSLPPSPLSSLLSLLGSLFCPPPPFPSVSALHSLSLSSFLSSLTLPGIDTVAAVVADQRTLIHKTLIHTDKDTETHSAARTSAHCRLTALLVVTSFTHAQHDIKGSLTQFWMMVCGSGWLDVTGVHGTVGIAESHEQTLTLGDDDMDQNPHPVGCDQLCSDTHTHEPPHALPPGLAARPAVIRAHGLLTWSWMSVFDSGWDDLRQGFTSLSAVISAPELVDLINAIFTSIDEAANIVGAVWK